MTKGNQQFAAMLAARRAKRTRGRGLSKALAQSRGNTSTVRPAMGGDVDDHLTNRLQAPVPLHRAGGLQAAVVAARARKVRPPVAPMVRY